MYLVIIFSVLGYITPGLFVARALYTRNFSSIKQHAVMRANAEWGYDFNQERYALIYESRMRHNLAFKSIASVLFWPLTLCLNFISGEERKQEKTRREFDRRRDDLVAQIRYWQAQHDNIEFAASNICVIEDQLRELIKENNA